MPPWAQRVDPADSTSFVTSVTRSVDWRAICRAVESPAMPEPTMSTSVSVVQPGAGARSRAITRSTAMLSISRGVPMRAATSSRAGPCAGAGPRSGPRSCQVVGLDAGAEQHVAGDRDTPRTAPAAAAAAPACSARDSATARCRSSAVR